MKILHWIHDFCNRYRRFVDVSILWPCIKEHAKGDLDMARAAFHLHTLMDPAWRGVDDQERMRKVEALE